MANAQRMTYGKEVSCVQTGILNACREQGEMPGQQTIHGRT